MELISTQTTDTGSGVPSLNGWLPGPLSRWGGGVAVIPSGACECKRCKLVLVPLPYW
jgi:hypothetical protein